MDLTPEETRTLGCLLEKELATPQYYPLTMNALVLACNQTSNRDPVVSYTETDVASALAGLREQALARVVHSSGQRADKYRHGIEERWGLDAQHRAIMAVLLLRGPQTAGELRGRTERLAAFDSLGEVEEVLGLMTRRDEPLVTLLARAPGQKEARWAHLLASVPDMVPAAPSAPRQDVRTLGDEVAELRAMVEELAASVAEVRALLE